jgi:uncharacterized membrane protein
MHLDQRDDIGSSGRDRRRKHEVAIVVLVCAGALAAGYVLKACPAALEKNRAAFACHTDITALYSARGIDRHVLPYVHARIVGDREDGALTGYDLRLIGGANEYPVLTGLFMWAVGFLADNESRYLMVSALLLAPFGLLTAYVLGRSAGLRALLWAASPALVLYAFHNWDLLVVGVATAGLWAWWRGRPMLAAALFGIGAAVKFYPMLFLLPLVIDRWRAGDRRTAISAIGVGAASVAIVNLPMFIADPAGWLITYRFHSLRPPNYDSLWGVGPLYDLAPSTLNVLTTGLFAISVGVILWIAERRRRLDAEYPFLQVCGALVASYLLWGKVHSPQFALWLLPFFVLISVRVWWWAAYMVDGVALYFGVFVAGTFSVRALELLVSTTVYVRAGLLLALIVLFLRSETTVRAAHTTSGIAEVQTPADRLVLRPGMAPP